ncbi:hypothetical protein [Vreelandella venusta]|uniref:Uncharacterized protein n=1 Tax=Vreelandella venusta TaxID=44935 RepID=A0AAP9ZIK0_9GAMM|nr:hypothetical protein [Halomonas venusta]QRL05447.1 hypothetical protein JDS37_19415 [Halomonas venusta]GEK53152.1 hypothetical protein HVE01_38730 [Halomonas venusta]
MKLSKKILLALILIFSIKTPAMSESRKDAWYTTSNGGSSVMESIHGALYASLYEAKSGEPNVYIEAYSPEYCRENGERTIQHDPVSINGTLVQFSQHCRGEWNLFFASTEQGTRHVINQFRRSNSVTVEHGAFTFIFSAVGFIEHYNKLRNNLNAI